MQQIADFNPGDTTTFPATQTYFLPGNPGLLAIINDSPYTLGFQFNNGTTRTCPGGMCRAWLVDSSMKSFAFAITNAPAAAAQAQVSQCVIEYYFAGEEMAEQFPAALTRLITIGNAVPVSTAATSLQNDGNPAGTQVIEAKASGLTASALLADNQGTLIDTVISNGAQVRALDIEPGGASTPATVLLHGTADKAAAVPATGVTAGALPAGVTLDGGSITGNDLPVSELANSGTLPAGIDVAGASVVGAVASASVASALAPGAASTTNLAFLQIGANDAVLATPQPPGVSVGAYFRTWDGAAFHNTEAALPGGGIPLASLASGALPAGVTIPAGQLTGTLPESQVGSGYPATALGAGALPAGVTLPGSQVTGDVAANQVGPGALDADVTLGAAQLTSGTVPASVALPAANLDGNPLPIAGGKTITGFQKLSVSSSGTYSHGIGVTPDGVLVNADNGSNSTTTGSGTYGATSVFVYIFSAMTCCVLVYKAG